MTEYKNKVTFLKNPVTLLGNEVKVGDIITIQFGNKTVTVRVDAILDSTRKEDAKEMFTILEEKFIKEENTDL